MKEVINSKNFRGENLFAAEKNVSQKRGERGMIEMHNIPDISVIQKFFQCNIFCSCSDGKAELGQKGEKVEQQEWIAAKGTD